MLFRITLCLLLSLTGSDAATRGFLNSDHHHCDDDKESYLLPLVDASTMCVMARYLDKHRRVEDVLAVATFIVSLGSFIPGVSLIPVVTATAFSIERRNNDHKYKQFEPRVVGSDEEFQELLYIQCWTTFSPRFLREGGKSRFALTITGLVIACITGITWMVIAYCRYCERHSPRIRELAMVAKKTEPVK